jgi:hypothetical protein
MYGVIHFEQLESNQTINTDFSRLNSALIRPVLMNMKKVLFHRDNAKSHVAAMTLRLGTRLCPGFESCS